MADLVNLFKDFKIVPRPIKIEGDCTITNYKNTSALNTNPFTIRQKDGELSVNGMAQQNFKDIEASLNIFGKIASMDGNADNLTTEDLKLARKNFDKNKSIWQSMGVSSFRYDPAGDVVNLTIGTQTLRIDFDEKNQSNNNQKALTDKPKNTEQKTTVEVKKTNNTAIAAKTQSIKTKTKTPDKYEGIKKEWIPFIKSTAKKYGYSEELIISKIIYEGFTPVAVHKNEGGKGGLNEVGFGHTTNANHNNKFKAGFKISIKQAFDWLGQDIKDKEAEIRKFGKYYNYDNIPQPLKEIFIDVAFNRGEKRLDPTSEAFDSNYRSVKANIDGEYWGSAAVRLRQEEFSAKIKRQGKEPGLRKRNVLRFLKLMNYLKPEKIVGAMDLFDREYYYTKTLNMLKKNDADTLKQQWDSIYYAAKAKCPKQA